MPLDSVLPNNPQPTPGTNGTPINERGTRFGEPVVNVVGKGTYFASYEGYSYRASSPTPGTGIAMGIQTTFSATANVLAIIQNLDTVGANARSILLDYVRLINTVAGATSTSSDIAIRLDSGLRRTAGGTVLANANTNGGFTNPSIAQIYFGAITASAETVNVRQLARARLKTQATPCWTVGDEVLLGFGADNLGSGNLTSGLAPARYVEEFGPIIIPPQWSLVFSMWNVANAVTAPAFECEFGWWERAN